MITLVIVVLAVLILVLIAAIAPHKKPEDTPVVNLHELRPSTPVKADKPKLTSAETFDMLSSVGSKVLPGNTNPQAVTPIVDIKSEGDWVREKDDELKSDVPQNTLILSDGGDAISVYEPVKDEDIQASPEQVLGIVESIQQHKVHEKYKGILSEEDFEFFKNLQVGRDKIIKSPSKKNYGKD